MPSEKLFGLDAASKAIWDRLDDKAKSIIMGYTKPESQSARPTGNSSTFRRPPVNQSGKPPFKAQVNVDEMSAYEFLLANIHDVAPSGDDLDPHVTTQEDDEPPSPEDIHDMRLINAVKSSRSGYLPPGDIRRVMSKSSTRQVNSTHL
jgi:hypothetical protein